MKKIASRMAITIASASLIVMSGMGIASASTVTSVQNGTATQMQQEKERQGRDSDFWFESPAGIRSFNIEDNKIVPSLLSGDSLTIDGNMINVMDQNGQLVANLEASLPDGVTLQDEDGNIVAVQDESSDFRGCIGNKWVGVGIGLLGDALVCTPVGIATGGVGGYACGAAVDAGIAAASC